jgi:3-phosphoshikimate 1-carboxyvinyltransferase
MLQVPFNFKGLSTLKIKETDRIEAMKTEMRKLGFVLHSIDDCELYWDGEMDHGDGSSDPIDTYEDHRMALSFAPAAFRLPQLQINNPQVVSKSYPKFWENLKAAGFVV